MSCNLVTLAQVSFKITADELAKFDSIAKEKQTSRAALLRNCIIETNRKYRK